MLILAFGQQGGGGAARSLGVGPVFTSQRGEGGGWGEVKSRKFPHTSIHTMSSLRTRRRTVRGAGDAVREHAGDAVREHAGDAVREHVGGSLVAAVKALLSC